MKIGEFEILPVVDGVLKVPASLFYPTVSAEKWEPHRRLLTDGDRYDMPTGGFLVRGPNVLALVDLGMGYVEKSPEMGGRLLESLSDLGHQPDEITDVLFSHLHFDHIGWSSADGKPVFESATYRCHSKDWDHFVTRNVPQGPFADYLELPGTEHWLGPIADHVELWEGNATVLPGIDACDAPGHTPGSTVFVVSSGDARCVLLGDAVHCPVELVDEEWAVIGDVDAELAERTREAIAREYEGTDAILTAPHFPEMEFGRLLPGQGRATWMVA